MNIVLLENEECEGKSVILTDHRAEHIVKILRAEAGDTLRIGQINGPQGQGRITRIKKKFPFEVELQLQWRGSSSEKPFLDLILALPRPIMLKRILSQVTALGVGTIHLIHANRVEKSFWEATLLDPQEYRPHLIQGLEQAVDTRLPEIQLHRRFKPFVEDVFPEIANDYAVKIIAHPGGSARLHDIIRDHTGRVALAIGPEGGWVDFEVQQFEQQGFCCCGMGSRILKVDTAVVAMHARISGCRDRYL